MRLKELIKKNRSYRGFREEAVIPREELLDMVDHARLSANAGNLQGLKFYIAREKEEVEDILGLTHWAAALKELALPFPGEHPSAFIAVLQDESIAPYHPTREMDGGIAAQSITLAAVEKGYGGLMIKNFSGEKLLRLLELPDSLHPLLLIALGQPKEEVVLEEAEEGGSVQYYRTENNKVHHVPKRPLKEMILEKGRKL